MDGVEKDRHLRKAAEPVLLSQPDPSGLPLSPSSMPLLVVIALEGAKLKPRYPCGLLLCARRQPPSPIQLLRTNPNLLLNIGEADLEADPLYGELTCAG